VDTRGAESHDLGRCRVDLDVDGHGATLAHAVRPVTRVEPSPVRARTTSVQGHPGGRRGHWALRPCF
jgi:hypothetical protein